METGKTVNDLESLNKKLAEADKKVNEAEAKKASLLKEIEAINKANQLKNICDQINDYSDILSILGADEKKDVIKIDKFDDAEHELVRNFIKKVRIPKAYNQGWLPKVGDSRWYSWWRWVSSGFAFDDSSYGDSCAHATSASRLCFKDDARTRDAAKKFPDVEEAFITG